MDEATKTIGVEDTAAVATAIVEAVRTVRPETLPSLSAGLALAVDILEENSPGLREHLAEMLSK